jgi:hypothetical protein
MSVHKWICVCVHVCVCVYACVLNIPISWVCGGINSDFLPLLLMAILYLKWGLGLCLETCAGLFQLWQQCVYDCVMIG